MLKSNYKQTAVYNGFIELGENDGKGKGRYFQSRFIEAGIAHYDELGDILITKETLNKFIQSMVGCPVIINHKDVTDKNVDKLRVGTISKVWYNDYDGWFYCEGIITDSQAIDLVKNQGWSVSCSYNFVTDGQKKTYHGKEIDQEFTDGEFLHLAIVENPRYEGANIVVNSKEKVENTQWITVKPLGEDSPIYRHIPLDDGVDKNNKEEVKKGVKEFFDKKKGKESKESSKEEKKEQPQKTEYEQPKENKETEKEDNKIEKLEKAYHEAIKAKDENDKALKEHKIWSEKWLEAANKHHIAKLNKAITDSRREYAEAIMESFEVSEENPYAEKIERKKEYYQNKSEELRKSSDTNLKKYEDTRLPFGQPVVNPRMASAYKRNRGYMDKAMEEYNKAIYYSERAGIVGTTGISSDDANAITKLAEKYKNEGRSAERRRIIDRVIQIHKNRNTQTKPVETSDFGFNIERNQGANRLQLKFEGIPEANVRTILKSNGFRWSPREKAWQRQLNSNSEYALKRVQEQLQTVNNCINEIKKGNLFMAVMDDLKDFILNVVNNACKNEKDIVETEEKEAENEKEEIEEEEAENGGAGSGDFDHAGRPGHVGGSEKAGTGRGGKYDKKGKKQWTGKNPQQKLALNEDDDDKEEKEEKFEEEKEIAVNEEEKEEIKEEKKDVKNSMEHIKDMAMGGNSEIKINNGLYTSQAERLELGNKF